MVVFKGVAAAHVVLADFSGDFRGFVFEEAVEVHNPVIDTVALTDAFNSRLVCFVVEGLLADAVVLLRLVNGEVVLVSVTLKDVRLLPFLLAHKQRPSDTAAGDGFATCEIGNVFAGQPFLIYKVLRIDLFVRIVDRLGFEHPLDVGLGQEGDAFYEFGPDAFFFQAFVQPALGYVVLAQDIGL